MFFPCKYLPSFFLFNLLEMRKLICLLRAHPLYHFLEPEAYDLRQLFQFPKFIVNEKCTPGWNPWRKPEPQQGTPRPADVGTANFIWLFFFLLLPALLLLLPPSFYQRGLAGLEGARKELKGPELRYRRTGTQARGTFLFNSVLIKCVFVCVCVWFSARPRGFNNIDLTYLMSIDSPGSSKKYLLIVCTVLQLTKLRHRESKQLPRCLIPKL